MIYLASINCLVVLSGFVWLFGFLVGGFVCLFVATRCFCYLEALLDSILSNIEQMFDIFLRF